ncbi:MAG: hypothetical protein U1F36_15615 [Planctomycetota bacterium]
MPRLTSLALIAAFAAGAQAQDPVLRATGGSLGQPLALTLEGQNFGQLGLIFLSFNPGPTQLSALDPNDPRSLTVGVDLLGLTLSGPLLSPPIFAPAPFIVPNNPSLTDVAMYFQGATAPGSFRILDGISAPRAVRFAPANAMRDRFVSMGAQRSFFPVIEGNGGRPMILGGGSGALFAQTARKDTEFFDAIHDTFSFGPDMTIERSLHTATRLLDGRWLVVGGVDRLNDPTPTAEIYDPVANTFTAVASMALQRAGHAAALLPDGRVLVSGGITDMNQTSSSLDPVYSITTTTEIYNPTTNNWSAGPALRKPRAGHTAITRADGRVLLCGGVSWYTFIVRIPSLETTTDLYTASTGAGSIAAGPTLRQARAEPALVSIGGGRWLLAGGVGAISLTQQGTPTAAAEIYDEAANTFTATGSMAHARTLHQCFDIGGGRYQCVGGGDGTLFAVTPLATCEIWNSATGTWSAGPNLNTPRVAYGAYVTASGQDHILGGDTPAGVSLSTEFYYR